MIGRLRGVAVSLGSDAAEILEPFIGHTAADTCVRATALSLGKTYDTLSSEDVPALSSNVRRLLSPIAPAATVTAILAEIEGRSR